MKKWFLFFAILFIGCVNNHHTNKLIDKVEKYLENNPDSAKQILSQLDKRRFYLKTMSEAERMELEMAYAYTMNKAYVKFTTDTIIRKVVAYYDSNGSVYEKMMSYYLLACVYRDFDDTSKAIMNIIKALELYNSEDSVCYYRLLYKIYGLKADIEFKGQLASEQIKSLDAAVHYAYMSGDSVNALRLMCRKSLAYTLRGDLDSVIQNNAQCSLKLKNIGAYNDAYMTEGATMDAFLKKNDYVRLKKAIDTFEFKSKKMSADVNYPECNVFYYYKAEYYRNTGRLDSSLVYYTKLQEGTSLKNRYAASKGLAALYQQIGNNDSISKYALLASELYDTIAANKKTDYVHTYLSIYDKKTNENIVDNLECQLHYYEIASVFLIICILIAATWIWRYMRRKQNEEKITCNKYTSKMERLCLEVKKLQERCANAESILSARENQAKSSIYSSIYYKKALTECSNKHFITIDVISGLMSIVENAYPNFKVQVNPKGTMNDLEYYICVLTKCGFKPSEISILLSATPSFVSKRRKKLMKDIFGIDGNPKDFDELIYKYT